MKKGVKQLSFRLYLSYLIDLTILEVCYPMYDLIEMAQKFNNTKKFNLTETQRKILGLRERKEYTFLRSDSVTGFTCKEILRDSIVADIRKSISSYPSDKRTAIQLYEKFIQFLREEYDMMISFEFPNVAIWDKTERQLAIIKLLHTSSMSAEKLSEKLFVSTRTIEQDLSQIKGENDSTRIMGRPLKVPFKRSGIRSKGDILTDSTAHPLFLVANLSQVIAILEGLGKQAQMPEYRTIALASAADLWSQLSDYARIRIKNVSDVLNLDEEWLEQVQRKSSNLSSGYFESEDSFSGEDTKFALLKIEKSGEACHIEYLDDDGAIRYLENLWIKRINGDRFFYETDSKEVSIPMSSIMRISVNKIGQIN